ncbi:MAG: sulfotransferase [Gammaproteobacteria bacterium]
MTTAESLQSAWLNWQRGQLDDALADCRSVLAEAPEEVQALHLLGQIHARQGDLVAAAEVLRQASTLAPDRADLHKQAGEMLGATGQVAEAEALFRKALALNPNMHAVRYNLSLSVLADGRTEEAAGLLARVVGERGDWSPAWLQYGGVLNALGRYSEAETALRKHLELSEDSAAGWTWLGASCQFQGRFEDAETCYRRAISCDPRSPDAHANLGKLLQAQGKPDAAGDCFGIALENVPGHPQALSGMATWLDNRGRYQDALDLLDNNDVSGHSIETVAIRARLLGRLERPEAAQSVLETALAMPSLPREAQVQLRFSLARVLDQAGEYERAVLLADEANKLRLESFPVDTAENDLAALESAVDELECRFDKNAMGSLPRSASERDTPVFVVGMPRSGKSLTEQVLCSHPAVQGAGELTDIPDLSSEFGRQLGGWPAGATRLTADLLGQASQAHLAKLGKIGADALRVTDTMPFNYLHLGLIELLFPNARVVHCVRHPLDLALRCYLKNFAGRSLAFTFSLETIARYIQQYQRMMSHWCSVSSLAIYESRYERLVCDPVTETRRLVDFLALPWDDSCLRFYEAGVATSASDTPIRRPLSQDEVGGWRHYEDRLGVYASRLDAAAYEDDTG